VSVLCTDLFCQLVQVPVEYVVPALSLSICCSSRLWPTASSLSLWWWNPVQIPVKHPAS